MIQTFARRPPYNNSIDLYFIDKNGFDTGMVGFALPMSFERVRDDDYHAHRLPALSLSQSDAQQLMDELWHCGLRPSEGSGSAGSLAATERHLADMRTMAFHALQVKP